MGVKLWWFGFLFFGTLLLWSTAAPAVPVMKAQALPTATPDAEGIIYIVVQANDSLWAIAARAGISLAELLDLNNLTESSLIRPGDRLIVGVVAATPTLASAAATVTPTTTRRPPTATVTAPPAPLTVICLVAFADENGNGERESNEPLEAGVAFTIFTAEAVVANYVTDGVSEPFCLTDLAAGNYQVTRSVGRGETLTNSGNRTVILATGDRVMLGFGGFRGATAAATVTGQSIMPTQTNSMVGSDQDDVAPEAQVTNSSGESATARPFLIGAGFLIGILLISTAVLLGRKRI